MDPDKDPDVLSETQKVDSEEVGDTNTNVLCNVRNDITIDNDKQHHKHKELLGLDPGDAPPFGAGLRGVECLEAGLQDRAGSSGSRRYRLKICFKLFGLILWVFCQDPSFLQWFLDSFRFFDFMLYWCRKLGARTSRPTRGGLE